MVVDVGRSMQQTLLSSSSGAKVSKADLAVRTARDFYKHKVLFAPKHEVGVVLFGTVETNNPLQKDGYSNVVAAWDGKVELGDLPGLSFFAKPPVGGRDSDVVNALIVAIDMMIKRTRGLNYRSKSVRLITDASPYPPGHSQLDPDLLECVRQLKTTDAKLMVTLIANANSDASIKAEDGWRQLVAQSGGQVQLVPIASVARDCSLCVRQVEQTAKSRIPLTISPDFQIPVGVYSKTTGVRPPTLKKRSKVGPAIAEAARKDGIIMEHSYHLADDPEGEEVKKEDRVKGYKYGDKIVPVSEYDEAALMYTCSKTLTTLGFAPANSISPEHSIHHIEAVAADKGDLWAYLAFESLVAAMVAEGLIMIARWCFRINGQPRMVALIPYPGSGEEASMLIMQYLPFMEDLREWTCAPLPPPSAEQESAVASLVTAMDLSSCSLGKPGLEYEHLKPEDTPNPALARFYDLVVRRATEVSAQAEAAKGGPVAVKLEDLDPQELDAVAGVAGVSAPSVAKLVPGLEQPIVLEPPQPVVQRASSNGTAERVKTLFGLAPVDRTAARGRGRKRFWREAVSEKRKDDADLEEVDIQRIKVDDVKKSDEKKEEEDEKKVKREGSADMLGAFGMAAAVEPAARVSVRIGSVNPERDFERCLASRQGGAADVVGQAIQQMGEVIVQLVAEGSDYHNKALSSLRTLRSGCVRECEPVAFNALARRLRSGTSKKEMEFWDKARASGFGLITDAEVSTSSVSAEEARAFLAGEAFLVGASSSAAPAPSAAGPSEQELEAMLE